MRTKLPKTIKSLTCAVLAVSMLFTCTADVQAAKKKSTWKTVKLNNTAFSNTKMELSKDGKTLTCYYSKIEKDGSRRTSVDVKGALPADTLKKFGDGEVYLYAVTDGTNWENEEIFWEMDEIVPGFTMNGYVGVLPTHKEDEEYDCEKGAEAVKEKAAAYKEELDKSIKYNNVTMTHEVDNEETEHTSAADEDHEGAYVITWDDLCSSTQGTGEVEIDKIDDKASYYLADKNGKKIINIGFEYKAAVEGIAYVKYKTKSTAELSEDGKTLTFTIATTKADGTERKSFNLKKLIPEDILKKFEDGKVYLYYTEGYKTFYERNYDTETDNYSRSKQNTLAKKAANAYKKKLLKKSKYTNVKVTHYRDFNERFPENSEKGKHSNNEAVEDVIDGAYVVSYDELLSSSNGSGKIKSFYGSSGYYLADKNGKKIIDIEFETYDYDEYDLGVTCNLDELKKHDKNDYDTSYIILKSGENLSEKLQLTGSCMAGVDYSKVTYDSSILTVKKDGTITAKKGKYGLTYIQIADSRIDYCIYVTDGSKKMFKAIDKFSNQFRGSIVCSLSVDKNGKYTIKKTEWD